MLKFDEAVGALNFSGCLFDEQTPYQISCSYTLHHLHGGYDSRVSGKSIAKACHFHNPKNKIRIVEY